MEIGSLMKSSVVSQVTIHTEAAVSRDAGKASPSFACTWSCRNSSFGDVFLCKQKGRTGCRSLKVQAIDAAQAFDFESKQLEKLRAQNKLKIGLVGFGNFGQFLAETMVKQGHTVLAHSRSDYSLLGRKMNVQFFRDADDFCEEHPEVIVLCTSILSTEAVLHALPVQRLRRSTLFVDVLSVKEFPRNLLLQVLPTDFDVLCTHPMFGPQSGKDSWKSLPFVYDKVRIGRGSREKRCEKFLNIFSSEGCRMVEMSCGEHDRYAASSQFITHTVGRFVATFFLVIWLIAIVAELYIVNHELTLWKALDCRVLGKLGLDWTPINTKGYETLLELVATNFSLSVNNTVGDSFDLYYGLFMYNINATEELDRLELAFDSVKKQLFSQLHNVLRSQLFDRGNNADQEISVPNARADYTEPVSMQLTKLKEATDKIDTVVETSIHGELSSVHGELQHH